MLILLIGCAGDDPGFPGTTPVEDNLVERWEVEGLTWDLALLDGRVLSTTQFGGSLYAWDPSSDTEEEIGDDLGETLGVVVHQGEVLFTVTDSGMTGYLARLDDVRRYTELVSQGDAGLPMRRLEDLVVGEDGQLYAADPGAEAVWRIAPDGSTAKVVTRGVQPTAVAFHGGRLHWATTDGVYEWDEGTETAIQVLDHGGYGLLSDGGELLVGTDEGVVIDGQLVAQGQGLGRAAAMVRLGDHIYVADQGQGSVWSFER